MLILIDQDGVLADFDTGLIAAWRERYPEIDPVSPEDRRSFYILEDYPQELRARAEALYTAPGFIRNLPAMPGALEAFNALLEMGMDVRICTSPLVQYENCVAEKYLWVEKHLGREATRRIIMTADKTLIRGDILIDDKPRVTGAAQPSWRHIVFDAPYNRESVDQPRMTWRNWRSVLAGELYRGDY